MHERATVGPNGTYPFVGTFRGADDLGPIIVAIPVRDEEARIAACLEAIDNQILDRPDHLILLLNNCSDDTASIIHRLQLRMKCQVHVSQVQLEPDQASAGYARYLAMEAAWELSKGAGILLTTDADGRVDPDWVGANAAAIRAGADAVAGWAELDPMDWGSIPLRLHEDDARECAYDAACDEIHALLDPDPADPLPRHTQASGASIAVTAKAYRAAGGMPKIAYGEDRAFIAALRRIDARIRHAPECRVMVSGRIEGRATGGMADTIRRRLSIPDAYLDDRLEGAEDCARRAAVRRFSRAIYDKKDCHGGFQSLLGMEERLVRELLLLPTFGLAWEKIETICPPLLRKRVAVVDLPAQQAQADLLRDWARNDVVDCRRAFSELTQVD